MAFALGDVDVPPQRELNGALVRGRSGVDDSAELTCAAPFSAFMTDAAFCWAMASAVWSFR